MDVSLFEDVAAIVPALVPDDLGEVRVRPSRWGVKVWFGPAKPPRQHYEAQVLGADADPKATTLCIEVGFHLEGPDGDANDQLLAQLVARRSKWKATIGKEAVAGDFLGGSTKWRRLSETWPDPDLGDSELAFEIAARLVDYATAIEPVLRAS